MLLPSLVELLLPLTSLPLAVLTLARTPTSLILALSVARHPRSWLAQDGRSELFPSTSQGDALLSGSWLPLVTQTMENIFLSLNAAKIMYSLGIDWTLMTGRSSGICAVRAGNKSKTSTAI
jgi:hypothetical protein